MDKKETVVTEQVTENVEQTTEQTPKTFTQDEVNEIVGRRVARNEARIRKEYDRDYGELMGLLQAGTGKKTVGEITGAMRDFYGTKGIKTPQEAQYSQKDIQVLANAEAEDIIRNGGYEEVVAEVDRMAKIGTANLNPRDKALFTALAAHRQSEERTRELSKLGVTQEVADSKEFRDFAAKFSPTTPISEVYGIYAKTLPQKNVQTMGSMKSTDSGDGGVKDYYSFEEASKFTRKDFERNPALLKAVEKSMAKWK